jgi:penicillin-binding protein 1C
LQPGTTISESTWLSASSIYLTFDALKELYRPGEETGWKYFSSSKKIAWKTGTSHGLRDGWAVGVNPDYAVGVWVGNADGEGRPGLTGTETAAPILFDLFALLPGKTWFDTPESEMQRISVCSKSGYRPSEFCEKVDTMWVDKSGLVTSACPFHKKIHLSQDRKWRVHSGCEELNKMIPSNWFILPPVQAYYYQRGNEYLPLPPFKKGCDSNTISNTFDLIYPKQNTKIFIPRQLVGNNGQVVFEAVHSDPNAVIYWHMDGIFFGKTTKTHNLGLNPEHGSHELTLIDSRGESITRSFEVL